MTNIKERILEIAKFKKINKADFFKDLGLSYANFKGVQKNSSLGSDTLVTILAKYSDINEAWLLKGTGEMFKDGIGVALDDPDGYVSMRHIDSTIEALNKVVETQEITIRSQLKTIAALEAQLKQLQKKK
ncbi:hypothetical protein [Sphingobacterium spiritivorum]|uniref:HTH cro/C1-type domain-containing protein n=1 Tax=Sphingobacterium spiritivorum ATCC 33861 TaxID=525373 RepID=D7VHZ4_SPHSI|nr:hypothetical protein [Sphingobacterium spiritivorum]EFK59696.1 hypothetical protein HMPREF0766_10613 [Sphingobacterium spiritivorum ATCC 33861]